MFKQIHSFQTRTTFRYTLGLKQHLQNQSQSSKKGTEAKSFFYAPKQLNSFKCKTLKSSSSSEKQILFQTAAHTYNIFKIYISGNERLHFINHLTVVYQLLNNIQNQVEFLHHSLPMRWMFSCFIIDIIVQNNGNCQYLIEKNPHSLSVHWRFTYHLEVSAT